MANAVNVEVNALPHSLALLDRLRAQRDGYEERIAALAALCEEVIAELDRELLTAGFRHGARDYRVRLAALGGKR